MLRNSPATSAMHGLGLAGARQDFGGLGTGTQGDFLLVATAGMEAVAAASTAVMLLSMDFPAGYLQYEYPAARAVGL